MSQERETALLFELRGEDPGAIHSLAQDVFRMGSDAENDFIMKDPGVALYQVEISLVNKQYVIKNLSLEGTAFLNEEPFEDSILQKGDILTLGDSMLRFVETGEALTQEELWKPVGGKHTALGSPLSPFRRVSFLAVLSLLALGVVVSIMFTQTRKIEQETERTSETLLKVKDPVDRKELDGLYNSGVDYLTARRWDEAILIFEKIRNEAPTFKDLDRLYQHANLETHCQNSLSQAKGLFMEGELVQAKRRLKEVPEKSVYFRESDRLLRELNAMILQVRLTEARNYLEQKDWMGAKREAEAVLGMDPGNPDAERILREAELLSGQSTYAWRGVNRGGDLRRKPVAPEPLKEKKETKVPTSTDAPKPKVEPSGPAQGTPAWFYGMALSSYRKGQPDQSLGYLDRLLKKGSVGNPGKRASAMKEDLLAATSYYHQANTLQKAGQYTDALDVWGKFLEKDRNLSASKKSAFYRKASASLGRIYYQRGEQAFGAGDLETASMFWRMAKRVSPTDSSVKKGLRQLSESARKFYREGYSLKAINPQRAAEKWKIVLQIVPPEHPYYQKAKRQLDLRSQFP